MVTTSHNNSRGRSLQVFGLDFTSAPTSSRSRSLRPKHLTLVTARLDPGILTVESLRVLNGPKLGDFSNFERWLQTPGPWVAGIDFPFGQPATLVGELGWPMTSWSNYVAHIRNLGKAAFESHIIEYRNSKPPGEKHLRRPVDVWARSISPMMLHGVPVGKMFFQGAPRLLDSPASIPALRPIPGETRTIVEAYPGLVARRWLETRSYKNDDRNRYDPSRQSARHDLLRAIEGDSTVPGPSVASVYGFIVAMTREVAASCVEDPTGDRLDSILCAIQAAWAFKHELENHGMPTEVNPLEGWIADPGPSRSKFLGIPKKPG